MGTEQVARMEWLDEGGYVAASQLLDGDRCFCRRAVRTRLPPSAVGSRSDLGKLTLSEDVEDNVEAANIIERLDQERSGLILVQEELRSAIPRLAVIGYAPAEEMAFEWTIHRGAGEGLTRIAATGATRLEPGDVLEVRIPLSSNDADALQ